MKTSVTTSKVHHTDILILGAGPAGCAAAISARQSGMSVVLLEARPAAAPMPGETLHPGLEPVFKRLGVWESVLKHQFHRHRGIWRQEHDGQRRFEAYGGDQREPWLGFQVDRARLSTILQARVADLGGNIIRGTKPEGLLDKNSSISGVTVDGGAFDARFVLDATGRRSWLARAQVLLLETQSPTQRLWFGWSHDNMPELEAQPLFHQRKDGWDWLSPLGDGSCAWVKLRCSPTKGGINYSWRIFRECAGPGYFLLGDAACLMDPSAANGVLRAMMSGIYAVHLISAGNQGAATLQQIASEYKRWMGEVFDLSSKAVRRHSNWNHAHEQVPGAGAVERLIR